KLKEDSKKKNYEFLKLKLKTKKEKGDVAGAKLWKFFNHISRELEKYFFVKDKEFEYFEGKSGVGYLILKSKKEVEFTGPKVKDEKNVIRFKKEHKITFEKNGRVYAKRKIDFSGREFLSIWVKKNKKKIKEMSILDVKFE